jgi:hypothetical protein
MEGWICPFCATVDACILAYNEIELGWLRGSALTLGFCQPIAAFIDQEKNILKRGGSWRR